MSCSFLLDKCTSVYVTDRVCVCVCVYVCVCVQIFLHMHTHTGDYNSQPLAKICTKLKMADQFRKQSAIKDIGKSSLGIFIG